MVKGAGADDRIRPWVGMKPKTQLEGVEMVSHEFKDGEYMLDFNLRGCSSRWTTDSVRN